MSYEVQEVTLPAQRLEHLAGFELDAPAAGTKRNTYVVHATGWAVGRGSRVTAIEVVYSDSQRLLRTVPVRGTRSDVVAALGDPAREDCVFHALVSLIGLKLRATLELRVVLADGTRVPAAYVTIQRDPLRTDYEPRLAPLLVTTLGRSGSTFLMQLLASHPQVVLFRRFPYESAPAKYWLHMLRVVSEPANLVESTKPDTFHNDTWWIGNNPYHDERIYEQPSLEDWFARNHMERLTAFMQRTIDDWYLTLARTQEQAEATYFAEKHLWPNYLPVLAWELYPRAKEVFLVRDFRDVARSIFAFDQKRGFPGFGRPDGMTDEEYVRDVMRRMSSDLLRSWQTRRDRAHLLRYEDLVFSPRETITTMLDYLELDCSPKTVEAVLASGSEEVLRLPGSSYEPSELRSHRTIADPKATIGRWRQEGDEAFREVSEEVFRNALTEFGYS